MQTGVKRKIWKINVSGKRRLGWRLLLNTLPLLPQIIFWNELFKKMMRRAWSNNGNARSFSLGWAGTSMPLHRPGLNGYEKDGPMDWIRRSFSLSPLDLKLNEFGLHLQCLFVSSSSWPVRYPKQKQQPDSFKTGKRMTCMMYLMWVFVDLLLNVLI